MPDFNRNITANEVIRRALGTMGLPKPQNVSDATDATSRQMLDLLTECGQELLGKHDWQAMLRTYTLATTGATTYPLPSDLERFLDDAGWNNSGRLPLLGPATPQQWRMLQARRLGGTTLRLQYVIRGGNFELYFAPSPSQTIQIDYISRGWVQDATNPAVFRDFVNNSADVVMFKPTVIINMLKYKWREAKGFDVTAARNAYNTALNDAKYADRPHNALNLAGRPRYAYLGITNLSDTNYGNGS